MIKQSIFDYRVLVASGIAVALGLSQTALADSAEDDLEIKAGLTESLTLSCDTALNFGKTRLGELERDDETTITVAPDDGAITVGGDVDEVTAGDGQAGVCTISGSAASENDEVTVRIDGSSLESADVSLDGDGSAFSGLDGPGSDIDNLDVDTFTTDPDPVRIGAEGGVTFNIGGQLSIPSTVEDDNLGGYSAEVTVEVDDGWGEQS